MNKVDIDIIVELYNSGRSLRQIGAIVNAEHHTIKNKLIKAGVVLENENNKDTSNFIFDTEKALKLYNDGLSCFAIGKELKCASKTVKKYLQRAGIVFEKSNYARKNLDEQIERIKELYDRGFNYTEIGNVFNTTGTTIKSYLQKVGIVE